MLIAYNKNKERVLIREAIASENYYCPLCCEELIQKKGSKKRWHFAHKPNRVCSESRFADMCEWHIEWQNRFPKDNIEVMKIDENGKKHIADVLINENEIEFQHSYMPSEEFNDRNDFYSKFNYHIIWIFDGNDTFSKGYNSGPFPFSKKFECLKQIKDIPNNLDIFVEGKTQLNLFTKEGLFLHHISGIDEKEGIIFDKKCTIDQFLDSIKNNKEIELSHTFRVGDDILLCHKVHQHFGANDSGMTEINKGQIGEEIVHGGVQVRTEPYQCDHAQVPHHRD